MLDLRRIAPYPIDSRGSESETSTSSSVSEVDVVYRTTASSVLVSPDGTPAEESVLDAARTPRSVRFSTESMKSGTGSTPHPSLPLEHEDPIVAGNGGANTGNVIPVASIWRSCLDGSAQDRCVCG